MCVVGRRRVVSWSMMFACDGVAQHDRLAFCRSVADDVDAADSELRSQLHAMGLRTVFVVALHNFPEVHQLGLIATRDHPA